MGEIDVINTETKLTQPNFITEISGIELKEDFDKILGPVQDVPEEKPTIAERVASARLNAGLDTDDITQSQARGVEDDGVDDNDDVPTLVEDVDSDSDDESDDEDDDKPDGGVPFFPANEEEAAPVEGDNPSSPSSQDDNPPDNLRRRTRVRKPRERFIPTMSAHHHNQGVYPG